MTEEQSCSNSSGVHQQVAYAGFWLRAVAYVIDLFILAVVVSITHLYDFSLLQLLLALVYFVGFNCSKFQGTPGKLMMSIKITDLNGNRITAVRSLARYCFPLAIMVLIEPSYIYDNSTIKAVTMNDGILALAYSIGYLMAAFTYRKQALHDIVCKTLVVRAGKCVGLVDNIQKDEQRQI